MDNYVGPEYEMYNPPFPAFPGLARNLAKDVEGWKILMQMQAFVRWGQRKLDCLQAKRWYAAQRKMRAQSRRGLAPKAGAKDG